MKMSIDSVLSAIRKHKRFLITSHINLEGDSLGSLVAFYELLHLLGKRAFVFCDEQPHKQYEFLRGSMKIETDPERVPQYDAAIILDSPHLERIGKIQGGIDKSKPIINIDHHISNTKFGDLNWVDTNASSAGEMIYELYELCQKKPNDKAALGIYVAILTDTGSFRYENTTPRALEIAADLLELGVNPRKVGEWVYETKSYEETKLLGLAISTLKVTPDKKVAYFYVAGKMFQRTGAKPQETERFINFARSIEGVEVAIFLRETDVEGVTKVSFRSKGKVDVNKIAQAFGGGGHRAASGCEIKRPLRKAMELVLAEVKRALK